jgi:dTDP-4-amino-4,6-dideoxygalactose transaminase
MNKIPFSPPRIDEAIIREVTEALRSGWITTGPRTKQLESKLAELAGSPRALCLSSWTTGMELLLRWWGVQNGDEVIVPAYTYCATANVVVHCEAKPVMVDVRREELNMDVEKVAEAITERTKVIIPVDLGGMPVDYEELRKLIEEKRDLFQARNEKQEKLGRIAIMADAAHSLGAQYQARPAASFPDLTVFSLHAVKNLTTAEGGAICINLPEPFDADAIYKELNMLSLHGQNKDALAKYGQNSWEYDVMEAGYKCNMPDVLAAIGLVEANRYMEDTLPKRRAIVDRYSEAFAKYDWAEFPLFETAEKVSSCHLYPLRIRGVSLEERNAMIQRIFDEHVSVNVHYKPLPLLTFYKKLGYRMADYPVSQDAWERVITLPVFYDLSEEQQTRVIEAVVKGVNGKRQTVKGKR